MAEPLAFKNDPPRFRGPLGDGPEEAKPRRTTVGMDGRVGFSDRGASLSGGHGADR